jgi:hypothetical protein
MMGFSWSAVSRCWAADPAGRWPGSVEAAGGRATTVLQARPMVVNALLYAERSSCARQHRPARSFCSSAGGSGRRLGAVMHSSQVL